MKVFKRARDEAVGAVGSIVKQLESFATNFPDIVTSAVKHLADTAQAANSSATPSNLPTRTKATRKLKAKPKTASAPQIKVVLQSLGTKDGVANHQLAETRKRESFQQL
jgi:hypothetical protein